MGGHLGTKVNQSTMMLMDGKTADFRGPSRGSRADRNRRRPIPDGKNVERALVRFGRTERYRREPEARTQYKQAEDRDEAVGEPPASITDDLAGRADRGEETRDVEVGRTRGNAANSRRSARNWP